MIVGMRGAGRFRLLVVGCRSPLLYQGHGRIRSKTVKTRQARPQVPPLLTAGRENNTTGLPHFRSVDPATPTRGKGHTRQSLVLSYLIRVPTDVLLAWRQGGKPRQVVFRGGHTNWNVNSLGRWGGAPKAPSLTAEEGRRLCIARPWQVALSSIISNPLA